MKKQAQEKKDEPESKPEPESDSDSDVSVNRDEAQPGRDFQFFFNKVFYVKDLFENLTQRKWGTNHWDCSGSSWPARGRKNGRGEKVSLTLNFRLFLFSKREELWPNGVFDLKLYDLEIGLQILIKWKRDKSSKIKGPAFEYATGVAANPADEQYVRRSPTPPPEPEKTTEEIQEDLQAELKARALKSMKKRKLAKLKEKAQAVEESSSDDDDDSDEAMEAQEGVDGGETAADKPKFRSGYGSDEEKKWKKNCAKF